MNLMVRSDICLITALEIPGIPYFDIGIPKKGIRILALILNRVMKGCYKLCNQSRPFMNLP